MQLDFAVRPFRARRFQPIGIVTVREIRLIVRAARFISGVGADGNDSRENQHVSQLAREVQRLIGPLAAVA